MHEPDEYEGLTQSEFKLWLRLFYEEMHKRGLVKGQLKFKLLLTSENYMTDELAVCGRIALSRLKGE